MSRNDGKGRSRGKGLTRREFIGGAAAAAGTLAIPGCGNSLPGSINHPSGSTATGALPDPAASGFDHVVVVMMENRSFDHFLGWVPGADGVQAGVSMKDSAGNTFQSYDLAPSFQNCDLADPDHTYSGGRTEINGGKMDGFLLTQPAGDTFPIGYYTADSLPFYKGCAANWTICDRYFSGILALTTPNRIYMHAGQTDRISNSVDVSTLPTIWDRMQGAGHSVAYYYADVPYTSFWGDKYKSFSKKYDMASFKADMAAGTLADLTYVDNVGNTCNEGGGISQDDHPYGDVRDGQAFLNDVYNAVRSSPKWDKTLMIINYDEWGGFADHVAPPLAPISEAEAALGNDGRLGCRVPCVIIGPRARRAHVEHMQFDPNSILNMLAWRFGFEPLGVRASSANIATALDFSSAPNTDAPAFDVPAGPFGGICVPTGIIGLPIPIEIPLPIPPICPVIPGLDVPSLTAALPAGATLTESTRRRVDHDSELQELRTLAYKHGFS